MLRKKIFNDTVAGEVVAKGLSFFVLRVLGLLASYVFAFLITNHFDASVYGIVSLCFSIMIFSGVLGRLGLDVSLVKYYSTADKWKDSGLFLKVLFKGVGFSVLLALLLYVFKDLVVEGIFKKPGLSVYYDWTLLTIPFWSITLISAAVFQAKKNNKLFAFFNNPGRFLLATVFLSVFLFVSEDPIVSIQAHFWGIALLSVICLYRALREFDTLALRSWRPSGAFIRESLPMMVSGVTLILLGSVDTFVLGIYVSEEDVGVYNIALKLATVTLLSLQAVNSILTPLVAESFQKGNTKKMSWLISFCTGINFFITLIVVSGILLFNEPILGLFGEEFIAGRRALYILCAAQVLNSFSGSVGVIMQMIGHEKAFRNIILLALVVNIALNFVLVPPYGINGAAVATFVSIVLWNGMGILYLKKKSRITSHFTLSFFRNGNYLQK